MDVAADGPSVAKVESSATWLHPLDSEGFLCRETRTQTSDLCDEFRDKGTETPARTRVSAEGPVKWPLMTRLLGLPLVRQRVKEQMNASKVSSLPGDQYEEPVRDDPLDQGEQERIVTNLRAQTEL